MRGRAFVKKSCGGARNSDFKQNFSECIKKCPINDTDSATK
jgi:hypothetical protein